MPLVFGSASSAASIAAFLLALAGCSCESSFAFILVPQQPPWIPVQALSSFRPRWRSPPPHTHPRPERQSITRNGRSGKAFLLTAKKKTSTTSSTSTSTTSRSKRVTSLLDWARSAGIQVSPMLSLSSSPDAGLGWFLDCTEKGGGEANAKVGSVLISVPRSLALSLDAPGDGPDDTGAWSALFGTTVDTDRRKKELLDALPWYVQMSLYLYKLDCVDATKKGSDQDSVINVRPWLDSLPRTLSTPLRWDGTMLKELQYDPLVRSVRRQEAAWKRTYFPMAQQLLGGSSNNNAATATATAIPPLTWERFLWGCEMSRSRAFSGYGAGRRPFDPSPYAFALLLATVYVGLGLGTLEQAANGAALVVCGAILKDFVAPKLLSKNNKKNKTFVICPLIDMANHRSETTDDGGAGYQADVSFEFFGNAYSMALASVPSSLSSSEGNSRRQVFISYGPRSNDQLLQYYGFVEPGNVHDVYLMPPLREWDVAKLEAACGRTFVPGRLAQLDRAGLLGRPDGGDEDDDDDFAANFKRPDGFDGEVVVTRAGGMDPAVMQALRALVSTEDEWNRAGGAIGNFGSEGSGGADNERCARHAARAALETELRSKPTTHEEDVALLRRLEATRSSLDLGSQEENLAIQFRIEKKKLLMEMIEKLS